MGCVSSQPISFSSNPPEPKITHAEIITFKSAKVLDECLDSVTDNTTVESSDIRETEIILKPAITWGERRNSEKEKASFTKFKTDQAKAELQKRYSLRTVVHSKCPTCGDLGPETSNQYYTFYLVVPTIECKTKCRRCNVHFSFEYVGMVKSHADAVNLVLDEEL